MAMGLATTVGKEVVVVMEVAESVVVVVRIRWREPTISWNGSGELMLLLILFGLVFYYGRRLRQRNIVKQLTLSTAAEQ